MSDCSGYGKVYLLSAKGKIIAQIFLSHLLPVTEELLPELQFRLYLTSSAMGIIISVEFIQEKHKAQGFWSTLISLHISTLIARKHGSFFVFFFCSMMTTVLINR